VINDSNNDQATQVTPIYKRYFRLGVALLVLGAVIHAIMPSVFVALAGVDAHGNPTIGLLDPVLTVVRWSFMPVGAAMIGASVVLKELSPRN